MHLLNYKLYIELRGSKNKIYSYFSYLYNGYEKFCVDKMKTFYNFSSSFCTSKQRALSHFKKIEYRNMDRAKYNVGVCRNNFAKTYKTYCVKYRVQDVLNPPQSKRSIHSY